MLDDRLCLRRGSFNNYVDQILPNCDHPRADKCGHFTYAYYFLFTWPCVDFLLTTYPPTYLFLVHVVIEWACGEWGPPTHIKLGTLIARHNQKSICFHFLFQISIKKVGFWLSKVTLLSFFSRKSINARHVEFVHKYQIQLIPNWN